MNTDPQPIEAETLAVAVREPQAVSPLDMEPAQFRAGLDRRKANRASMMEWVRSALVEGTDFGSIPTKRGPSKPSLWKPGAEKICGMLGVTVEFPTLKDYEQAALKGIEFTHVVLRCQIMSHGSVVAEGVGARSLEQDYGDINKCLKMAEKSAHIDATLRLAGLSEVFTQDIEDLPKTRQADLPAKMTPQSMSPKKAQNAPTGQPDTKKGHSGESKQATEVTKEWFLKMLAPVKDGALAFAIDRGWIMPNEGLDMIPLEKVPTSQPAFQEIMNQIRRYVDGGDQLEGAEAGSEPLEDSRPKVKGIIEHVNVKDGTSKHGPWTLFGIKVGDGWFHTFNKDVGRQSQELQGKEVVLYYKEGPKGNDCEAIMEV